MGGYRLTWNSTGRGADSVLWAFPLYVFTVCSQYERFIELIRERGAEEAFRGQANRCAYEGKDGFIERFRNKVMGSDLLVYAGTIKDRSFFNTHQGVLRGKQFLVLAAGPLSYLGNLRETLQAYVE